MYDVTFFDVSHTCPKNDLTVKVRVFSNISTWSKLINDYKQLILRAHSSVSKKISTNFV